MSEDDGNGASLSNRKPSMSHVAERQSANEFCTTVDEGISNLKVSPIVGCTLLEERWENNGEEGDSLRTDSPSPHVTEETSEDADDEDSLLDVPKSHVIEHRQTVIIDESRAREIESSGESAEEDC